MLSGTLLNTYARLVLSVGVNLQKGQGLEILCPVDKKDVAAAFSREAYALGAKMVRVRWNCDETDRITYENADLSALTDIPKWYVESKNYLVKEGYCYVAIDADDPAAFLGVDENRLSSAFRARRTALKKFSEHVMSNAIRWCVASVPSENWAKAVFPDSDSPMTDLSDAIEKTMRLDEPDPVKAWEEHINTLDRRAAFLNSNDFSYLIYKSANGTDLKIGLADGHEWLSAKETAKDGVSFVANMPTEEVFTCPHRLKADGVAVAAKPLSYNGNIVDGFSIKFKNGKVVDFSAEKGYETLKGIIKTDGGSNRLGEVALIGKNSPVAKTGILFYNTLFDENASCHLALGKAYPTTVKNGGEATSAELKNLGVNDSVEHVDFMIGSPDLSITGVKKDGSTVTLFKDGEWAI